MENSGIKEFDELLEQYKNKKIDLIAFASRLWNEGYKAGKEEYLYKSKDINKSTTTQDNL